jgi:hypothetical protein
MSTDIYQTAYERTMVELAEINEQLEKLTRRKQLLEKLLAPVKLVAESAPVAAAGNSNSEFSARDENPQMSTVILVDVPEAESSPLETQIPFGEPQSEAPNHHAESNGRCSSDDEVADLAYRFWNEGGRIHGRHEDDWHRAAHELQNSLAEELQNSA